MDVAIVRPLKKASTHVTEPSDWWTKSHHVRKIPADVRADDCRLNLSGPSTVRHEDNPNEDKNNPNSFKATHTRYT